MGREEEQRMRTQDTYMDTEIPVELLKACPRGG
jgi:hypothetical protein